LDKDDVTHCYYDKCRGGGDDTYDPTMNPTPQPTPKPTRAPTDDGNCGDQCKGAPYNPVCCQLRDGDVEFDNRCLAECELPEHDMYRCYYGTCDSGEYTEEPTEYPSEFPSFLPSIDPTEDPTRRPPRTPSPTRMEPTPEPTQDCEKKCESSDYDPVCCDGTTYDNRCFAACDGVSFEDLQRCHYGECDEGTPTPTMDPTFYPSGFPTPEPTEFPTIDSGSDSADAFIAGGIVNADDICCSEAGELQGMTCRCRRSCAGDSCTAGYGIAFDGGQEKCSGSSVCCCGEQCNKKERSEDDSCDVGIGFTQRRLPNVTTTLMTQCETEIQDGARYDFVIFVDDSCGLEDAECEAMLDGAGTVVLSLLNYPYSRVKMVQFGGDDDGVDVLVDLDDELQLNGAEYVRYIRKHGQCKDHGAGNTALSSALESEAKRVDKGRNTKFVVISRCRDDDERVCALKEEMDALNVDLYAINLMANDGGEYLLCLMDGDRDRVCIGDLESNGFGDVMTDCLLPPICSVVQKEEVIEVERPRGFGDD